MNDDTKNKEQEAEIIFQCPPMNKDEELYKASLPAFFTNELEADKTILGLSVAAIGFYMALFLNKDLEITELMFITIIISLVSFLIVSSMILMIFARNKKQLLHIIETTGGLEEDTLLELLDKFKYWPFIIGILCSIIFTLSLMFTKINHKEETMEKDINQTNIPSNHENISEGFSNVINVNLSKGYSGSVTSNHPHHTDNHVVQNTKVTINNSNQSSTSSDGNCTNNPGTNGGSNE